MKKIQNGAFAQIKLNDTDSFFNDSPEAGDPECICSRCRCWIDEDEIPLRVLIDREVVYTKDEQGNEKKELQNVPALEFRLCEDCQQEAGII